MLTITSSAADMAALRYGRVQPPDPRLHGRLDARYWRSQRVPTRDIPRLWGMSNASVHRALQA
jgi:hypothetical protein